MERNILITSLSAVSDRQNHSYYRFEDAGRVYYCDGLSVAEAGTKYLLSSVPIDTIIAVGGPHACHPDEPGSLTRLKEWTAFSSEDTGSLSEYGFFRYRINQFLNGLDLEAVDVLERITDARRNELLDGYQKLMSLLAERFPEVRPDRVFHLLAGCEDHAKLMKEAFGELSAQELCWIKRFIYVQLNSTMKLYCREDSENLNICFVQMRRSGEKDYVPAQNVTDLIQTLNSFKAERMNIYMDMQGLESDEGYMILGVLAMLGEDVNNPVFFREIITTRDLPGSFVSEIDNDEKKRYDINRLVSGMSAFIRYGKVDEIRHYWESCGISDRHVDVLLYAMQQIDAGISLCNIPDLENGIRLLKRQLNNSPAAPADTLETGILRILENTVRMDYGALLEGEDLNELELIRWALRKQFYQQAVTIVESRMPAEIVRERIFYYAEDEDTLREFSKELNLIYWETAAKDRWCFKDIEHYFIKFYGRSLIPAGEPGGDRERRYTDLRMKTLQEGGGDTTMLQAYTVLNDRPDLIDRLLFSYYYASTVRNHINHAEDPGADSNLHEENPHLRILVDAVQEFLSAYDAVRAYMNEQNLHPEPPLMLDPEKFKGYTYNHKPTRKKLEKAKKEKTEGDAQEPAQASEAEPKPSRKPDGKNPSNVWIDIEIQRKDRS